jgi:hypothetical protein
MFHVAMYFRLCNALLGDFRETILRVPIARQYEHHLM